MSVMKAVMSMAFDVDGTGLVGERWGRGDPVLVFLHAGVCDRRSFYGVIERLDGFGTTVAYDRRGYGETPPAAGDFSHLADLDRLLTSLAPDAVWLVGSSMGGGLALDAALTMPDRVAGVVLLAPAVSGAPEAVELDDDTMGLFRALDAAMGRGDLEEANRLHVRVWLDGPAGPEGRVGGAARELALAMNATILANGGEDRGASGVPAWDRLGEITVPMTIAYGDRDIPVIIDACRAVADRVPGARLVALEGTAHLPYMERPEAVATVLRDAITLGSA